MTIVRALDRTHEWLFGKGKNDYVTGNQAVAQNINTRLQSFVGDCFFDLNAGIDRFNLMSNKNQVAITLAVSAVILNTPNVTSLLALSISLNDATRKLTSTYQVQTFYSKFTSSSTLSINAAG